MTERHDENAESAEPDVPRGDVLLVDATVIRARRRPLSLFLVWVWELATGFFIATPIHAWASSAWGSHPDGDAVLFRPGGLALLTWLSDSMPPLAIVVRTAVLAIIVFGVLGLTVTGALIASLATGTGDHGRSRSRSYVLRVGAASLFPLTALALLFGALEGFVLAVGLWTSSATDHALQARVGDAGAFTARVVILAFFVVAMLVVGVFADLARVAVVRDLAKDGDERAPTSRYVRNGITTAIRAARGKLVTASLAWGWRAALSLGLVYAGARAGDMVGGRGGSALWLLFAFHQIVVFARVGLRASWLAKALRLVGPPNANNVV